MQVRVLFISGFAAGSLRGSGGLVVAARSKGRVAEEFAGGGVDDACLKVLDEQDERRFRRGFVPCRCGGVGCGSAG
jgi:hypothetical protein